MAYLKKVVALIRLLLFKHLPTVLESLFLKTVAAKDQRLQQRTLACSRVADGHQGCRLLLPRLIRHKLLEVLQFQFDYFKNLDQLVETEVIHLDFVSLYRIHIEVTQSTSLWLVQICTQNLILIIDLFTLNLLNL